MTLLAVTREIPTVVVSHNLPIVPPGPRAQVTWQLKAGFIDLDLESVVVTSAGLIVLTPIDKVTPPTRVIYGGLDGSLRSPGGQPVKPFEVAIPWP